MPKLYICVFNKFNTINIKVLVDILPALGHFYGSLKTIEKFREAGCEVIFLNVGQIKSEVEKYGFQTCYNRSNLVNPLTLGKQRFNFQLFWDKLSSRRLEKDESLQKRFCEFEDFIQSLQPDLVLLDEQNMLKAIYYEVLNIKVVCIETKPDPLFCEKIPPFTSSYVPSDTKASRLYCWWLWRLKIAQNYYRLKKKQINSLGTDDYSGTLRLARKYGINLKSRIDLKRSYGIGLRDIPRIVLSPVDFDFPRVMEKNTHRIGPLVDLQRRKYTGNPRFDCVLNKIKSVKGDFGGRVVYCSLGTITEKFDRRVQLFFKKIIVCARLNFDDIFILSTGSRFDVSRLYPCPDNVFIFKTVPQVELLKVSDIMISHGGVNSMTECVLLGVPTLNYPLSYLWDQPGCAARAVFHKIGLKGNLKLETGNMMSRKLNNLKSNYDLYRENVLTMRAKFELANQSNQIFNIIREYQGGVKEMGEHEQKAN